MYTSKVISGAKGAGVVAAVALMTMSIGSASAATPPIAADSLGVVAPQAASTPTNAFTARFVPAELQSSVPAGSVRAVLVPLPAAVESAGVRPTKAVQQAKFTAFTTRSDQTRDLRGVEPSLYRGKYYRGAVETVRLCIVKRESEGHYDVVNPTGSYRGAYQVSFELARGATWMMLKEHKSLMGEASAKRVLAELRKKPINQWPRYWQDALFSTVANWDHTGSGLRHWAGGRWHC